ncbi:hypothetical protein [Crateriforma conspicua]|uniref:hypothetical protein n=1 Tax=Crateriforma conspicua TaxID=2527996 RepID=UPI0011A951DF|nr:hypothetical protein [Crateriforma conspicua]
MTSNARKVGFQLLVRWPIDADMGVPLQWLPLFCHTRSPVRDRIAGKLDRHPAAIPKLVLFPSPILRLSDLVMTFGHEENEPVFKPSILNVREPSLSASGSLPWGDIDSVFFDQFLVSFERIFPDRDSPCHVPKIAVAKIVRGNQLNHSLG